MKKTFSIILLALLAIVAYTQGQLPQNKMPILGNYNYSDSVQIGVLSLDSNLSGVGTFLKIDTITGLVSRDTIPDAISSDSVLNLVRANVDTSGTLNLQQVTDNDSVTDNGITINSNFLNVGFDNEINASFPFSMALGAYDTITGNYVLATGFNVYGKGNASVVHGLNSRSIGDNSFSSGDNVESWGNASFSQGANNFARSVSEFSIGVNSVDYAGYDTINIVGTDRLFNIGNGTSTSNRNNALTMLKNGTTTIDTTWSYDASMSPYSFSGLEIPHAEWVQNNTASPSIDLQDVTDNGATTTNEIVLSSLQASGSGGLTLQSSGNNSVFTVGGGGGTNTTFFGNVNMSNNRILNVPNKPADSTDAVNLNLVDSLILQTDTFRLTSAEIIALGTGEDTLLTTTTGKFIDVISLSLVSIGGTGYTFEGDIVIKSENGTISTPATTILTSAGSLFRKSSIQDDAELGEHVIFDIQVSGATAGNKNLAIVVHYKIITI